MRFLLMAFPLALFLAAPASATMITNLDYVPHVLLIDNYGQMERVAVPPNAHIRRFSNRLLVRVEGTRPVIDIRDHNEYVIWPGGRLSIQKRGNTRGCCVF